jgi:hypothetical protein
LAADSATGINESVERMKHLAGIKQSRVWTNTWPLC